MNRCIICGLNIGEEETCPRCFVKSENAPEYKINEKEIYTQVLDKWEDKQITMVFEEMAELQKELCKATRGQANILAIAEEIADVEIMLAQMKIYFGIADAVSRYKTYKLKRLEEKLR